MNFSTTEPNMLPAIGLVSIVGFLAWFAHYASYQWIKRRTLQERRWDYNICCGTTDGGGINADIIRHTEVPNFERVTDVTKLPHPDGAFEHVLCSHTIEHVEDPAAMYRELRRIGRHVTILVPPLWDFTAALNPFEHQVIFLTLRSRHENHLPRFVRFGLARWIQSRMGQQIKADTLAGVSGVRFAKVLDYCVPALFLAGAFFAFAGSYVSGALFPLGLAALWGSKRT